MILKYSTEHLVCERVFDKEKNQYIYTIKEKGAEMPVAVYINPKEMLLSPELPVVVSDYKYYDELGFVVMELMNEVEYGNQ